MNNSMSFYRKALAGSVILLTSIAGGPVVGEQAGGSPALAPVRDSTPIALRDRIEPKERTVYLSVDGMC